MKRVRQNILLILNETYDFLGRENYSWVKRLPLLDTHNLEIWRLCRVSANNTAGECLPGLRYRDLLEATEHRWVSPGHQQG